jgi:hypothetical protein
VLKNITLSADERLITLAREEAERRGTTLNAQFRIWLANYVEQERVAHDYRQLMKRLDYARSAGPYTRDELNER